jgi:predicted nuclease with TOPRIM domain
MKNIRLLEKRVHQAVERLKQLSEERRRLEEELHTLRRHVEAAHAAGSDGDAEREWAGQRAQIATLVRETLSELTAD